MDLATGMGIAIADMATGLGVAIVDITTGKRMNMGIAITCKGSRP